MNQCLYCNTTGGQASCPDHGPKVPEPIFRYPIAEGWVCPRCHRIWNPAITGCLDCNAASVLSEGTDS